jgi:hypothetical protein
MPASVVDWLKERADQEHYPTFNRYLVTKLMEGALDERQNA